MNKIKCPNCGTYNLSTDESCVDCGAPLYPDGTNISIKSGPEDKKPEHPASKFKTPKPIIFVMAVVVLVVIIGVGTACYNSGKQATRNAISTGLDSELADKQTYNSNLQEYIDKKDSYDAEIASMQSDIAALSSQAETIRKSMIPNGKGVKLPAGQFIVGKDIPAGRYKVTGTSNFMIDGSTDVNTILKGPDDDLGVSSYVCTLSDGDSIKAEGADTFTPIS